MGTTSDDDKSNSNGGINSAMKKGMKQSVDGMRQSVSGVKHAAHVASTFVPGLNEPHDYRREELQRIEKKRRAILLRVEESTWKVLTHWDGTVLRILSTNPLLYITMALFVTIRIVARETTELPGFMGKTASQSMTVLGGFLSFFLVFYVNQNHKRYFKLYNDSMACKGRIFDVATLAVTTLPFAQATRLVRYMNAAHATGYVGLSEVYPCKSYFNYIEDQMGLLTAEERQRLDIIDIDNGGSANREIIAWCMNEIQVARSKGLLDPELANEFRQQILKLRAAIGFLYNAKDLPIPFFYVHFICLLTTLYLPLFAITSAIEAGTGENIHWSSGVIRGLVVFLQAVFVVGLRIIGQKMSDPYGDDLIDLSVMFYVNFTWTHSQRILNTHFPEEASAAVETDLIQKRLQSIGNAWETEDKATANTEEEAVNVSPLGSGDMAVNNENRTIKNPRL